MSTVNSCRRWIVTLVAAGLCLTSCGRPDSVPQNSTRESRGTTDSQATVDAVVPTRKLTWDQVDDPRRDGWTSEARAEQITKRLKQIGAAAAALEPPDSQTIRGWCDSHYSGTELLPPLTAVFTTDNLQVQRMTPATLPQQAAVHQSPQGFEHSLRALIASWSGLQEPRFEVKVVRVLEHDDTIETRQYVAFSGTSDQRVLEQHALWIMHWSHDEASDTLRIRSIDVQSFEQTTAKQKLFADCTQSVLGNNASYRDQMLFGMNHWLERIQDMRYFALLGNPGLAVGDVNGDGLDDLYVCQEANLPNRLYLQQPDGTAVDASAAWQADFLEGSRSALLIDLDNDGDQDLCVAILGGLVVASNEQDEQKFVVRVVLPTNDDTTTLTAADYDQDGDLDVYVCVDYPNDAVDEDQANAAAANIQGGAANPVYHDSNGGGPNTLYRNEISDDGEWKFVDATAASGLDANNQRFSWSSCWEDYDNDGDLDLYVANDFGRNCLYRNDDGRFTNVAPQLDVEDSAAGMSANWSDVNRDGYMDIYVSNMFSSAGSRITEQPEFKPNVSNELKSRWRRFAMGNTLFRNDNGQGFDDISQQAGITLGRWSWSSNFLDINNDGWQDLAVANGYITAFDTGDL